MSLTKTKNSPSAAGNHDSFLYSFGRGGWERKGGIQGQALSQNGRLTFHRGQVDERGVGAPPLSFSSNLKRNTGRVGRRSKQQPQAASSTIAPPTTQNAVVVTVVMLTTQDNSKRELHPPFHPNTA